MTLQPIRRTASHITTRTGELLPRLFTLTGKPAVFFCYVTQPSQIAFR